MSTRPAMKEWERFRAILAYQPFDRLPVWYFGTWHETRARWHAEGLPKDADKAAFTGMDPEWEEGMWEAQGLVDTYARNTPPRQVIEEAETYRIVRTPLGAVVKESKPGSSIPQHMAEALKPTREAWRAFKRFFDASDPDRRPPDWESRAMDLNDRDRLNAIGGATLYGAPREWLGVEQISYLCYDDPALYEEIIAFQADFYMELYRPILSKTRIDFIYFFEDCCGRSGPLFSPDVYRKYYHKHYKRMIDFFRSQGVPHVLVDSDGFVEPLLPCWLESGFDIVFPIEVGAWKASPVALRKKYGKSLHMLGGVDKLVIPHGEAAIRRELEPLVPLAREGGYIPIPDHRIQPDVSLAQFMTYVRVFKDVFRGVGG